MQKPHNRNTPFHWEGEPSIFTTGKDAHHYGAVDVRKHLDTSLRYKPTSIGLPGGSPYRAPTLMKKSY